MNYYLVCSLAQHNKDFWITKPFVNLMRSDMDLPGGEYILYDVYFVSQGKWIEHSRGYFYGYENIHKITEEYANKLILIEKLKK
jgi:hypothetical protein